MAALLGPLPPQDFSIPGVRCVYVPVDANESFYDVVAEADVGRVNRMIEIITSFSLERRPLQHATDTKETIATDATESTRWTLERGKTDTHVYYDIRMMYPLTWRMTANHYSRVMVENPTQIDPDHIYVDWDPLPKRNVLKVRLLAHGYYRHKDAMIVYYESPPRFYCSETEVGRAGLPVRRLAGNSDTDTPTKKRPRVTVTKHEAHKGGE
jgi:hypothetical protein